MDIGIVLAIVGLGLAVIVLLFTSQGEELKDNLSYWLRRDTKWVSRFLRWPLRRQRAAASDVPLEPQDRSKFIRDVTVPDGSPIRVSQKFVKIWEIQNVGLVPWKDRYLQREGPSEGPGRLKSKSRVRIPYTPPGQRARIRVIFIAPDRPGSQYCEWKMVDERGTYVLPNQQPLHLAVDVVY